MTSGKRSVKRKSDMAQEKEYFAFISYKSEDVEWAIWLQHELEHYHLPASFNGRTDVRQDLRPVFRDIDELSAGNLPSQIEQALANSQNLIVICSPQAAKSPWVNQEIETFISLGKTDHIFPFVVDGNSPAVFFPPALLNLPKSEERLGGDVSKNGRDAAFVKVVAGMLDIGFDALWNRYEKEKAEIERKEREQRDKLFIAQSRFISEKAHQLVQEGDAYLAQCLAIEILPKNIEHPNRPYTTEAEKLLRLGTGNNCGILKGHIENVTDAIYSPDGNLISTASGDMTIRLWDSNTGMCLKVFTGHTHTVTKTAFSPNGQLLASSSVDQSVRIWIISNGENILTLTGHGDVVNSVAFSPDGKNVISTSNDDTIRIWDITTGLCLKVLKGHDDTVYSVSFSPDGTLFVTSSKDTTIRLWKTETGECVYTFKGHSKSVNSSVFSPDGHFVLSSSWDNTMRIWDIKTGKCVRIIESQANDYGLGNAIYSPDGKTVVSQSGVKGIVQSWDISTGEIIKDYGELGNGSISYRPDGKQLAVASYNKIVRLIELGQEASSLVLRGHRLGVNSVEFSHDGKLLLSSSYDNTVRIWDVVSGKCERTFTIPTGSCTYAAFSQDDKLIASVLDERSKGCTIIVLETETGNIIQALKNLGAVYYVSFSPDENTILSASYDGYLRSWDLTTGECKQAISSGYVNPAWISHDGEYYLAVSENNRHGIEVWNIGKKELLYVIDAHNEQILSMRFSPDRNYFVSSSSDCANIWQTESGKLIGTLKGHNMAIHSVTFNPDGTQIATASADGSIRIWEFKPLQQLIDETRERFMNRQLTQEERRRYYLE